MTVQVISNDFASLFNDILFSTREQIKIISPFIGSKTAEFLSDYLKEHVNCKCKIITRFYREDFIKKASSLSGLESLLNSNVEILSLQHLHTKLYLFDNIASIMGSANFTSGGFFYNHELSVIFTEENEIINNFHSYFDGLWDLIKINGSWEISLNKIEEEKRIVNKILSGWTKDTVNFNPIQWGAELKEVRKTEDLIEEMLNKQQDIIVDTGIWLKFEGTGNERIPNNENYRDLKVERGDTHITMFPLNPKSIKKDDWLYLTVVSYDKHDNPTPIIIGRARTDGYKLQNKVSQAEIQKYSWMKRFPYYIELRNTEIIDTIIKNGVPLLDAYRDVGKRMFPTTLNKDDIKPEDLTHYHFRRSHMHITEDAKKYLDKRLDELFLNYGKISF